MPRFVTTRPLDNPFWRCAWKRGSWSGARLSRYSPARLRSNRDRTPYQDCEVDCAQWEQKGSSLCQFQAWTSIFSFQLILLLCMLVFAPRCAASVAPISANSISLADPDFALGPEIEMVVLSLVWSAPGQVGSLPWSRVRISRSPGPSSRRIEGMRPSAISSALA